MEGLFSVREKETVITTAMLGLNERTKDEIRKAVKKLKAGETAEL